MPNILVPVQRGHDVTWLANYLQKIHLREHIRVHLLSVQPRYTNLVNLFFSKKDLTMFRDEDAAKSLAPIQRALEAANVPYNLHIRTGDKVTEIVKFAKDYYCPQIVLGPTSNGGILDVLFGTLNGRIESHLRQSEKHCEVL